MPELHYRTITLRDGTTRKELVLTPDWQQVPEGWMIPPGADISMDLNGTTKVRLSQPRCASERAQMDSLPDTDEAQE